jgi:hypothetical protein
MCSHDLSTFNRVLCITRHSLTTVIAITIDIMIVIIAVTMIEMAFLIAMIVVQTTRIAIKQGSACGNIL